MRDATVLDARSSYARLVLALAEFDGERLWVKLSHASHYALLQATLDSPTRPPPTGRSRPS
jgi:hypothetical protein